MNKILLSVLSAAMFAASSVVWAQNPVIRDQFTADPTARVFGDKVYLFPSHDIISPVEPERKWFCMADYHVFSSSDLKEWQDHGVILSQERVPWGKKDGYSMWAPDCVEKNGKYYFYFPDAPQEGFGFAIGVAVADRPEGPYVPQPLPIAGVKGIDPVVLQTSSGEAYLIWSGMGLRCAKLSDDMLSIVGESVRLDEGFPEGFKEGPFAFERNGKFYLTYPWVKDKTETLAYAMSDSPTGPYTFKGLIMEQSPTGCWTNHHSLVEFKGQWYLFYHHNDYSPQFDKNRSVRIDKVAFNADGTIQQVTPTLRGVGVTQATERVELDRYSRIYPIGTSLGFLDPTDTFKGWYVSLGQAGAWVEYNGVDFEGLMNQVKLRVRTKGCKLRITTGEDNVIATCEIPETRDFTEFAFVCTPRETIVHQGRPGTSPTTEVKDLLGVKDIRLTVESGSVEVDWITFQAAKL